MSPVKLECSICEFVFEANIRESGQVRCVYCGHTFSPSRSAQYASTISVTCPPLSEQHQQTEQNKQNDPQEMIGRVDQVRSSILLQRIRARRRSNLILLLLFIATLASGALVAKRFKSIEEQRQQQIADSNFSVEDPKARLDAATTSSQPTGPQPKLRDRPLQPPTPQPKSEARIKENAPPTEAAVPVAPPKFPFLSASVAADQAAYVKTYMMLLEIESLAGTTFATGIIVDSRGYLLTSLPAVIGATKIQVSSARRPAQIKNQAKPPMLDTVRSVVAVSTAQRWVLLEINRRFVLNAADIRIPKSDRLVSRQPLLRVVAPHTPLDHAVSEMRVDVRRKSSALAAKQKELLNISADADEQNWILSPYSPYDRLGAALISADGSLMAILVSFDQKHAYYISTCDIGKRLKNNDFTKQPLSSLR